MVTDVTAPPVVVMSTVMPVPEPEVEVGTSVASA